jgi:hypothetical protein
MRQLYKRVFRLDFYAQPCNKRNHYKIQQLYKVSGTKEGMFFLTYDALLLSFIIMSFLPNVCCINGLALTTTKTYFQNLFNFNDIFS